MVPTRSIRLFRRKENGCRLQAWRSCRVELGGGAGHGDDPEESDQEIVFKGYRPHASKEEPQYIIKSDKTDHLAIHKGSPLKKISSR
jgi:hypothetical protein